ncbi:MAG: N-6 DNA methylase [Bacillota bacterium]
MSVEYIEDYATGRKVRNTPEEKFRQLFEHILIDDLGYPKEHIDIEVVIQRGAKRNAEEADIVVYKNSNKTQENAYIVIEIETPNKSYDLQALSYVTATPAPYCVWFAGYEENSKGPFYHYRDLATDPTTFIEIPSLPRYGETQDTIGKYRKSDLKPAKALKILFKRIHFKLYGSGPIKKEENVAQEVIKLLFCKILDEISPEDLCKFRATPEEIQTEEGRKIVKSRIDNLYSQLLLDPDFGELFEDEELKYDDYWITYIVSELQGIGLLHEETNTDALGDAYEVFLPSTLKGESGQFFTPREVVRFAINVIAPSFEKKEIILDTACGSGGFLTIAIEFLRKQIYELYKNRGFTKDRLNSILKDYAGKYIHGIDIEPLLYRIAKSYMAIIGDGKSNIHNFDSLEPFSKLPEKFTSKIKPGTVDIITTNPPFGTKIDDTRPYVLQEYDLGHRLENGVPTNEILFGQDPDKLFLERDIVYLKEPKEDTPGGRMVIVLPRQNLSGTEVMSVELRKWLLNKIKIVAIIDLPREAFQPHTGTKTSLVFLEKTTNPNEDYEIFMAVSESVGHDRRGNPVYLKDDSGNYLKDNEGKKIIHNDLPQIYEQWLNFINGKEIISSKPSCFKINVSKIREHSLRRLDAWFWDPNKNDLAKKLEELSGEEIVEIVNLGDLAVEGGIFYPGRHRRNYVKPSDSSIPFYSGTQILQVRPFDLKHQPKSYKPARNHFVEKDWILITRSGSTGRVIIVNDYLKGSMVTEHVIRVIINEELIDPYYVYAFLASPNIGKILMEKGIYASVVDHLSPDFIASIPIPRLKPEIEASIAKQMRESEEKRSQALSIFNKQINDLEEFIIGLTSLELSEEVDNSSSECEE